MAKNKMTVKYRLTKIYTRAGDKGKTSMADGRRVKKDDSLVHAIGESDELNAQLSVLLYHAPMCFHENINRVQHSLFNVGSELTLGEQLENKLLQQVDVDFLETELDKLNVKLNPLEEFILPGGSLAASHCHVARTVCRRFERQLIVLTKQTSLNPFLLSYVNRLSDYLFVLARAINQNLGVDETYWKK